MAELITLEPIFERISAADRRFQDVVVLVHHYGGHKKSFKKHVDFINALGFDVITFDLPLRTANEWFRRWPVNRYWSFGLRHVWADKIEDVLRSITENKFIFSFSSPSAATLMAIARIHGVGVKGWICEGGPFVDLAPAIERLLREGAAEDLRHRFFSYAKVRKNFSNLFALAMGQKNYIRDMRECFASLPEPMPILSFRGLKDPLVTPHSIEQFFLLSEGRHPIQVVELPNAGHLNGFNLDHNQYTAALRDFLLTNSRLLEFK